jgi:hypothetical protein|tara:strand:+ start:175 stop:1653 length:1479 start_codon:yes stop_codon:yes gene_type:complete
MPLGALKVALLGAAGSGSKSYWALMLHPNTDGDESTFYGIDVDSNDNVYLGYYDSSGYEAYITKFEQSGDVPTVDTEKVLTNYVSPFNLTIWDDGGTDVLTFSGSRGGITESCFMYSLETDLTAVYGGLASGIYMQSGDQTSNGSIQTEVNVGDGTFYWSSIDALNYFGWKRVQAGCWLKYGWSNNSTAYPGSQIGGGFSVDSGGVKGNQGFQWGDDQYGTVVNVYGTFCIAGQKGTNGMTQLGSIWEFDGTKSGVNDPVTGAAWNPGETTDDYLYWVIASNATSSPSVDLVKINTSGTIQWNRQLTGNNMYSPGSTGGAGAGGGALCKPIFDSSNNVYIAWGDRLATGQDRASIAKYNSSGVLQWQNQIITLGTGGNQFCPTQLRLSDDGEDLYVSINRTGQGGSNGFTAAAGLLLKVPSDGTMTSSSYTALNGGLFKYMTSTYTESSSTVSVNTSGSTANWQSQSSASIAGTSYPYIGGFSSYLHTAELV